MMRRVKFGLMSVLSLILIMLVIQNTASVQARFLWFSGEVPVILLLALTGIGGVVLGLLVAILTMRDKKPDQAKEYTE